MVIGSKISVAIYIGMYYYSKVAGCGSVWLERSAGGREVAGSNPVIPIQKTLKSAAVF